MPRHLMRGSVEWSEYLTEALDYASSKKGEGK